jgi:hypothetical protein
MAQFLLNNGVGLSEGSAVAAGFPATLVAVSAFTLNWLHSTGLVVKMPIGALIQSDSIDLESSPVVTGANPTIIAGTAFGDTGAGNREITLNIAAGALVGQNATISWQWNGVPFSVFFVVV